MNNIARCLALIVCVMLLVVSVQAQQAASTAPPQSISQTGLLPVYGIDVSVDASGATFQPLWDALKPCGFNSIRFSVDVQKPDAAAAEIADYCVWAKSQKVYLLPVLKGAESGKALTADYGQNVADMVTALTKLVISGDNKQAYSQILAFQLEDRMNHAGLHDAMPTDAAAKSLLDAASQLRKSEQAGLKDSGLDSTPILVNASFDFELVNAKAMAGVILTDSAYNSAYSTLKTFLSPIAVSPDVDLICVEWLPGSISAGTADRIPALLQSLKSDLPGKQILFATGYSTGFNSVDAQKQYFRAAFSNAADFRAHEASSSTFLGMFLHEAFSSTAQQGSAPTLSTEKWDWSAKSGELSDLWTKKGSSPDLVSWLASVESNMGVLTRKTDGGSTTYAALPGQVALLQIAGAVADANTASAASASTGSSPSTTPSPDPNAPVAQTTASSSGASPTSGSQGDSFGAQLGTAVKGKVQEGLLGLLDKVFQKLDDKVLGTGSGSSGSGYYTGTGTGYTDTSSSSSSSASSSTQVLLSVTKVDFTPVNPKVGDQVNCNILLQNKSSSPAYGLTVAAVDGQGCILSNDAQQSGISIDANATKSVTLSWLAGAAGQTSGSVKVYDATFNEAASSPVQLTVADSSSGSTPGSSTPTLSVACTSQDVTFAPAKPQANASDKVSVAIHNTAAQDTAALDVLLVDADAPTSSSLLAEADGNVIPANNSQTAELDWTPQTQKAYNLSVQIWLGYDKMVSETKLPAVTVAASGDSGSGGSVHPPIIIGRHGLLNPPLSFGILHAAQSTMPPGLPLMKTMSFESNDTTPLSGKLPFSFSLANPYAGTIPGLTVLLLVDGKKIDTMSIGPLLPQQNRSLVFNMSALKAGKHSFQIKIKRGSGKGLQGTVKSDVTISSRMLATISVAGRMSALQGQSKVRDLLPKTFSIGGKTLLARPLAPSIMPAVALNNGVTMSTMAGNGQILKPAPVRPVVRPVIPGVTAPAASASVSATVKPQAPLSTLKPQLPAGVLKPQAPASAQAPVIPGVVRASTPVLGLRVKPDLSVVQSDIDYTILRGVMRCKVTIHSKTNMAVKGAKVNCVLTSDGGNPLRKAFTIDVTGNGSATVRWSCPARTANQIKIEATIVCPDDAVPDNNRASRVWNVGS